MRINNRKIGYGSPPYLIAEMSANHNGDINNAYEIIKAAKESGADAIKIQTYTPDTITLNSNLEEFTVRGGLWDGYTLYDLYKKAQTPWDWHKELFDYARSIGITMFSSPFDQSAVDFLENLNAPAYKIASFEAIDLPLIRYASATKKPIIISTGMANIIEIEEAIDAAKSAGCSELAILHCVSGYPAPSDDYNLLTISDMQKRFNVQVGLSDHSLDHIVPISSVALGATIVEKHFTLNKLGGGPDDSFSMEPGDFKNLSEQLKSTWLSLGGVNYEKKTSELGNIKFRRSLYFVKDLKLGEKITSENIRSIRPGYGLAPKEFDNLLGKKVKLDISAGTATSLENIDWES